MPKKGLGVLLDIGQGLTCSQNISISSPKAHIGRPLVNSFTSVPELGAHITLFCFPVALMSILLFLCLLSSDGGGAAPVSVRLSTGPGCQRTAGDPWPLRLLRHPGAA